MPRGPKGEKRPADVVGAAVKVAKIATGEIEKDTGDDGKNKAAVELGRKAHRIGLLSADARTLRFSASSKSASGQERTFGDTTRKVCSWR